MEVWFGEECGKKMKVFVLQCGLCVRFFEMVQENVEYVYCEKVCAKENFEEWFQQFQKKFCLLILFCYIECVDVLYFGGVDMVVVIMVIMDGEFDKSCYCFFCVKKVSGGDDYGVMYEVLL